MIVILFAFTIFFPLIVLAAPSDFSGFISMLLNLIALLIPVLIGLALLFFFWGLARFILKAGDLKAREDGKNIMIWGIIALFVMVSLMGLIAFAKKELEFGGGTLIPLLPTGEEVSN